MPTLRRRRQRNANRFNLADLDISDRLLLTMGAVPDQRHRTSIFASDADLRDWWNANRDELLAEYIERSPGCRPRVWWRFERPEDRRIVGRVPRRAAHSQRRFYCEQTDQVLTCDAGDEIGWNPLLESEVVYLDRLDLLTEAERLRVTIPDPDPGVAVFPTVWALEAFITLPADFVPAQHTPPLASSL